MDESIEPKEWLNATLNDPIVSILLRQSALTTIQLESILIDNLAVLAPSSELRYEDKALLRLRPVSRGAFNRSLRQARHNVVSSAYTMLLLAYLGLMAGPIFHEYETLAEELHRYKSALIEHSKRPSADIHHLLTLQKTLSEALHRLSTPSTLRSDT